MQSIERHQLDRPDTFSGYGVIEVPQFQSLLRICREGFEQSGNEQFGS